ncbi:MAG: aminoglycoside phosphotransferase [Frankiales bacterium]|nr:aminoglycoside phosphotransferase [Frankiales bacterium]MCW2586530.1 aminoglycoside phosphotransferase [Frankiales bacterium]
MTDLLRDWLPRQRWFGGKGRPITEVTETASALLQDADPVVRLAVVHVAYADGDAEDYQLLLGSTKEAVDQRLEHSVIGDVNGALLYDAVHDPVATGVLLEHLAAGDRVDGLTFTNDVPIDPTLPPRVLGGEQSNTSVVYGDTVILKLFRRLQPGANPDIEVTKALADAGSTHVAQPLAWVDGTVEGETTTLGLLQPFLRHSAEGWAMATASVRDLFAEGDLHADEVGGDFAAESERLGLATGEVHQLMAQTLPSAVAGPEESRQTAQQLHERLDAALAVVPELAAHAAGLRAVYDQIADRTEPVPVQRVHGDYHLGQVLRTQEGWVLLDFEGEPARPLQERRALMSPLRDVAGMLRSFDYAAQHLLAENPDQRHLAYRAAEWAERNREAFCDGYARAVGADPRDEAALLRAFELDKAVYEVVYEARNRPTWLDIPLGSIARLVGARA